MGIDRLNSKISFLESGREGLKSKLAAYPPVISFLKDNITSLEQTPALQTKVLKFTVHESQSKSANVDEQSCSTSDGLSDLQDLQSRIKAIESVLMIVKKNSVNESTTTKAPSKAKIKKQLTTKCPIHDLEKRTELRKGIHMNDIPLDHASDSSPSTMRTRKRSRLSDQLLELWENSDLDSSHT